MTGDRASSLRRLDDRLLPAAARFARRLLGRLRAAGAPGGRGHRLVRTVRDQPMLAASAALVVLAAVLLLAVGETGGGGSSAAPAGPAGVPHLGPTPGQSVAGYVLQSSVDLGRNAAAAHGRPMYAVVDLRGYQTPAQASATFAGVEVARVYLRVPAGALPTQVHTIAVRGIADLAHELPAVAAVADGISKNYAALAAAEPRSTQSGRALERRYAALAHAAAADAAAFRRPGTCACVFAAVVHAGGAHLLALSRRPAVRVVDAAPADVSLDLLSVLPLQPEVTGTVPKAGQPGV